MTDIDRLDSLGELGITLTRLTLRLQDRADAHDIAQLRALLDRIAREGATTVEHCSAVSKGEAAA
jgi:hypothetical protein